jgi:hypothetical protein
MGSICISVAFFFDITRSGSIQLGLDSSLSGSKQVNGAWWIFRIGEERVKSARASPPELTLHLHRKPALHRPGDKIFPPAHMILKSAWLKSAKPQAGFERVKKSKR